MTIERKPDRAVVIRIIAEEAAKHLVSADAVAGCSRLRRAEVARNIAIRRILAETGCSERGLAKVWGLEPGTVRLAKHRELTPHPYDEITADRLAWAHGETRAAQIIAGHDPATLTDLAAWRRVWNGPHWARL